MAKTIIVTGASKGLGLAIATYIVKNGHNVVAVARSEDLLEKFQRQYPKQVRILPADLALTGSGNKAVRLANDEYGAVDGLILNHGVLMQMNTIANTPVDEWKKGYAINVFSAIEFVQEAIPSLRKSKGAIVFCSSGASTKNTVAWSMYASAKSTLNYVTGTLAAEEPEITSIAIAPGTVDTDMQKELREVHRENLTEDGHRYVGLYKEGKLLRPEQPGSLMARLTLDPPRELTGKYLRWDVPELAAFRKECD